MSSSSSSAPPIVISPQESSMMSVQFAMELQRRRAMARYTLIVLYSCRAVAMDFVVD